MHSEESNMEIIFHVSICTLVVGPQKPALCVNLCKTEAFQFQCYSLWLVKFSQYKIF